MTETKIRVHYGRSSQRRHHRLTAPLEISLRGSPCATTNWSAGGFRCRPEQKQELASGECIPVTLCVPFQDFRVAVDVQAKVVRISEDGSDLALQFIELPPRARELLYFFSENLLRGEMAPIDGTIRRLDLPVTPPSPQAPKPPASTENRTRGLRSWMIGSSYVLIGTLLTTCLSYVLYKSLFVVTAEQAMVYAPTVDLIGPDNAVISGVYVQEGDEVSAGTPLVELTSTRLAQQLSEARIQEREAKIDADRLASLVAQEHDTLRPYQTIAGDQVAAALARLDAAEQNSALLQRQRDRMKQLIAEGYVSAQELDKVESSLSLALGSVNVAKSELQVARSAEQAARQGRYFTSNRLEGRLPELKAELVATRDKVALASARVQELEAQSRQLTLRAPVAGRVRQAPLVAGSSVSAGAVVVSLQTDELPRVYAVVRSDHLERIGMGRRASVHVPAISLDLDAQVIAIEPRIWTLPENVRRLLGNPADAGLVVLSLDDSSAEGAVFNPGLPVLVEMGGLRDTAAARWLSRILGGGEQEAKQWIARADTRS
jgi:multidrug resistance efflux pump